MCDVAFPCTAHDLLSVLLVTKQPALWGQVCMSESVCRKAIGSYFMCAWMCGWSIIRRLDCGLTGVQYIEHSLEG